MPHFGSDTPDDYYSAYCKVREELDRVTHMLGRLCETYEDIERRFEGPGARACDYRQAFTDSPELMAWWKKHKADKAALEALEDKVKREAEDDALQRALAKTSGEERAALIKNAHLFR